MCIAFQMHVMVDFVMYFITQHIPIFLNWLFIAMGIPLAMKLVPVNHVYGFRTGKTMSDDVIWYSANAVCGWSMIVSGVVSLIAIYFINRGNIQFELKNICKFASWLICTLLAVVATFALT